MQYVCMHECVTFSQPYVPERAKKVRKKKNNIITSMIGPKDRKICRRILHTHAYKIMNINIRTFANMQKYEHAYVHTYKRIRSVGRYTENTEYRGIEINTASFMQIPKYRDRN